MFAEQSERAHPFKAGTSLPRSIASPTAISAASAETPRFCAFSADTTASKSAIGTNLSAAGDTLAAATLEPIRRTASTMASGSAVSERARSGRSAVQSPSRSMAVPMLQMAVSEVRAGWFVSAAAWSAVATRVSGVCWKSGETKRYSREAMWAAPRGVHWVMPQTPSSLASSRSIHPAAGAGVRASELAATRA